MCGNPIALAELQPIYQLICGASRGRNDHQIAGLTVFGHDTSDSLITFRIRQATAAKLMQLPADRAPDRP
jgi:hypothetical protein